MVRTRHKNVYHRCFGRERRKKEVRWRREKSLGLEAQSSGSECPDARSDSLLQGFWNIQTAVMSECIFSPTLTHFKVFR